LRYAVEPLDALVAPPYDVISDEQRTEYLARSPYNVVHLTLPDSEEQAAADLVDWRANGVLVEDEPRYWWVAQDYTGPDGVRRTRMWPIDAGPVEIGTPLLIADGHHRYETAVAYREENPEATHTFAILVSSRASGLEIFPTHRLVQHVGKVSGEDVDAPGDGVTLYRNGRYRRVESDDDFGPRVVESFAPEGVTYTAYADDAIAAVDRGEAEAAFLLQPVTVEQVARFALAGETMPQKSTFFYPKLTSGLLFHPIG
jgi:uncharacterized protein (DUF1015 family)